MSPVPRAVVVSVLPAALGCGGGIDSAEPIRLGVVSPVTGDLAVAGKNQVDAVLLAIEEINRAGGVLGRPLALDTQDDRTTTDGAGTAYTALLSHGAPVILGPIHSAGVNAIATQIRTGHTLTLSGGATSPGLSTLDDGGFFFRTVPSDAVQASVLARRIRDAGHRQLCIVFRRDAYGMGLADALRARLAGTLVPVEVPYDPSAPSLAGVLAGCEDVRVADAAGIVFVTFEGDGAILLDDASARGWTAARHGVFLVDGNRRPELFAALSRPGAFDGAVGTAPSGPDASSDAGRRLAAFQARFMAHHQRAAATNAENHYDCAYLAAMAIELAGTADDTDAIRDAMRSTTTGAAVAAGDWAGLRAAIDAHRQADYRGASGEVDLDAETGELLPPYYVRLWTVTQQRISDQEVVTLDE